MANTDWCIGSEEFRRELLAQVSAKRGLWHYLKNSPFKVSLAHKLRAATTQTLGWIARRLQMGTRGYLAQLLLAHTASANLPTSQSKQQQLNS